MKNTENIKAPEAFLIERGGQQTDHKAAHSRHSDGASKTTQGSLSLQEPHQHPLHQEKQEHPKREAGSCPSQGGCPFRETGGRLCRQSPSCWPPRQKNHWADVEILGSWKETFRNMALGQLLSCLSLPQAVGMGGDLSVFGSPNFCLRLRPEELQINK